MGLADMAKGALERERVRVEEEGRRRAEEDRRRVFESRARAWRSWLLQLARQAGEPEDSVKLEDGTLSDDALAGAHGGSVFRGARAPQVADLERGQQYVAPVLVFVTDTGREGWTRRIETLAMLEQELLEPRPSEECIRLWREQDKEEEERVARRPIVVGIGFDVGGNGSGETVDREDERGAQRAVANEIADFLRDAWGDLMAGEELVIRLQLQEDEE